jgi:hypothetical protein
MTISDINAEARDLCDADTNSYPAATLLRRVNAAYEEIVGKLIALNGSWDFDDTNYTDMPIATTSLVDGQQDYTFDASHLSIERVQVLDSGGIWQLLDPIDRRDINIPMEEHMKDNGLPMQYDKNGNSLLLYPKPSSTSVTLTNGLRVYFRRTADIFTSAEVTTGTKEPGFASPYHILLAYKAALPFCAKHLRDRVPFILSEINRLEKELFEFESEREKDVKRVITTRGIRFR